jgi:hypothetical protein
MSKVVGDGMNILSILFEKTNRWYRLAPESSDLLPEDPGVYVFLQDAKVLYVGVSTTSVWSRVAAHFSLQNGDRDLSLITDIAFSPSRRFGEELMREARLIRRLRPTWNIRGLKLRPEELPTELFDTVESIYKSGPLPKMRELVRSLNGMPEFGDLNLTINDIHQLIAANRPQWDKSPNLTVHA